ncbi:hypothetical protein PVL29_023431 [Vitis rotundifolia]|uniref:Protein EXORDIUM-like n=1 Tax=Vitis rotundifolia TaxID=103349 RepID=A0AA38YNW7_VITRO|nr:hypothetical protein PVL29_023431 [Vitis rotundifolia]
MVSFISTRHFLPFLFVISLFHVGYAARKLNELVQQQPLLLEYHNGPLLSGKISISLIWYGKFKPSQRAIVSDFITSLSSSSSSSSPSQEQPSVATWWKTTEKYYHLTSKNPSSLKLSLGEQILDEPTRSGSHSPGSKSFTSWLEPATNPFGNGYFQGPAEAPLEAASACPGVYGKGAYPGYAGELLVDSVTGASFNAHGANGRKYLLPALYDPSTSSCSTLV